MKNFNETVLANSVEEAVENFKEFFPVQAAEIEKFNDRTQIYKRKNGEENVLAEMEPHTAPVAFFAELVKPILNDNKIKTVVKKEGSQLGKGARKWITVYKVCYANDYNEMVPVAGLKPYATRQEALISAKMHTGATKETTHIVISKALASDEMISTVNTIEYRPAKNERKGTYLFFGKY